MRFAGVKRVDGRYRYKRLFFQLSWVSGMSHLWDLHKIIAVSGDGGVLVAVVREPVR